MVSRDNRSRLLELLGDFPQPCALNVQVLESVSIEGGVRHKIEYTVEESIAAFDMPEDKVRAYLFVPNQKEKQRLPAIVAIHQDGPHTYLGKLEPAGLDGAADQHFGLELFQRGYVVICPDRLGHAERRRVPNPDPAADGEKDSRADAHWTGQLLMLGRTHAGKETYDLVRATDVLCSLDYVDSTRIGAIGHSAGGYNLVYFMFADRRIRVGVSSCGFFEVLDFYNENAPMKRNSGSAIPGLAKVGRGSDYAAYLAPRPLMMTRGMWEWGTGGIWREYSIQHVAQTRAIEEHIRAAYKRSGNDEAFKVVYFEDGDGDHAFPLPIREQAYAWIDKHLVR